MRHYRSIKLAGLALVCAMTAGCQVPARVINPAVLAVYKNTNGDMIKMDATELVVDGKSYLGENCSTQDAACVRYGHFAVFSVPNVCDDLVKGDWTAGTARFGLIAIAPSSGIVVRTSSNGNLQYTVSLTPGQGVVAIQYDPTAQAHMADRPRFPKENSFDKRVGMVYFKQSGPAILPCK